MEEKQLLSSFEERYKFLYDLQVGGVPIYTCFRDEVLRVLQEGAAVQENTVITEKGRIFPRRIFDTFIGLVKNKKRKTLVFTSSMFRRDSGRNLAAEYLLDRYSDSVVFEWPSRNDSFDSAYFKDSRKKQYVPLDGYILLMKMYSKLRKKKRMLLEDETRKRLVSLFGNSTEPTNRNEVEVIQLLTEKLPVSYAQTQLSHDVFRWLFKGYKTVETAVDFWGSARENIIPVLQGSPKSVELQHGIITSTHPGYIYPKFVKEINTNFFNRKLLVQGKRTSNILIKESVFSNEQIEVIGNPRIIEYRKQFKKLDKEKNLVLFTSQPFEQDGKGGNYYFTVIPFLRELQRILSTQDFFQLAIKLHPRENNGIRELYKKEIPCCKIFDNSSDLYGLLNRSYLHVTANSTCLYEAAEFDTPTLTLKYLNYNTKDLFGEEVIELQSPEDISTYWEKLKTYEFYNEYLEKIKRITAEYM